MGLTGWGSGCEQTPSHVVHTWGHPNRDVKKTVVDIVRCSKEWSRWNVQKLNPAESPQEEEVLGYFGP